ncbi:MAG TPA: MMPL family transporter [Micromonospora sp.]
MLAALGRVCFSHRYLVLLGWLLVAVGGVLATGPIFEKIEQAATANPMESARGTAILERESEVGGHVVALVDRVDASSPEVRQAVSEVATRAASVPGVHQVNHPYLTEQPIANLISADGRAFLVIATLSQADEAAQEEAAEAVTAQIRELRTRLPGAQVRFGGDVLINKEWNQQFTSDLQRAELVSLPLTLVVLIVVFGGVIAAGLPVLAAIGSVLAAMVLLLGFSLFIDLGAEMLSVVTLLGLALSIDYGLLLVARYREETVAGFPARQAVERAWSTAGRTVAFSGLTVAAALTGLFMFDIPTMRTTAAAGISVALVAMVAALTIPAAMIGLVGRWIGVPGGRRRRFGIGLIGAGGSEQLETGVFARLARAVQRRPIIVIVTTVVLLLSAGTPLLTATLRVGGIESLPHASESRKVAEEMAERFGMSAIPAVTVVARTGPDQLNAWAARWRGDPAVRTVEPAEAVAPNLSTVDITLAVSEYSGAARDLVRRIRADRPPVESWVTGNAASLLDMSELLIRGMPWAIGTTLIVMVVLLFLMTGSLVVPLTTMLMNVVSLGATFGVLVGVFEHGWLASVLNTLTTGGLDPFSLVSVFAFAFALSMDYTVFLLSRVVEYVRSGKDTATAVRHGLQRSGRVITAAAVLMIVVFSAFVAAESSPLEQIGLGLAVAVLVDATVVRMLLVPAVMTVLGRGNWWAPRGLSRWYERTALSRAFREEEPARETLPASV